jgi:OOP family OmpA-OmpF porin
MVSRKSLLTAGVCAALASWTLSVQAAPPGPYINAGATYEHFDPYRHLDDTLGEQFGIGDNITRRFGLEADFRHLNPDGKHHGNPGTHLWTGEVDGLYHFLPGSIVEPFVLAGLDYTNYHYSHLSDRRRIGGLVGAGLLVNITHDLAIRGDARAEHEIGHPRFDTRGFLGLQYSFGAAPAAQPTPTPAPAPAPVRRAPAPDSDHDGVPNNRDRCPNTPPGAKVNKTGCQIYLKKPVTHTLHVHFALESAKVQNHDPEIAKLAHFLREYPSTTTTLKGYTDTTGPADYNLKLSQRRAKAVRKQLINEYHITPNRLKAKGYGERNPAVSNATRAGRQRNRRVVAVTKAIKKVPATKGNSTANPR